MNKELVSRSALIKERPQNKHLINDAEPNRRRATKHGCYYKPWYKNYRAMMDRCYCSKVESYPQYGGAGITVCEEWHNIKNFQKWVERSGYAVGLTLDRIDGTKGYSPENCRWATPKEQSNNRRNTFFCEYKGERRALTDWASLLGMNKDTLYDRIHKRGWSVERAFETPVKHYGERREDG